MSVWAVLLILAALAAFGLLWREARLWADDFHRSCYPLDDDEGQPEGTEIGVTIP